MLCDQRPERQQALAARLFREAYQRDPGSVWVCYSLAQTCLHLEPPEPAEAVRLYSAALALRQGHPEILIGLARAWQKFGAPDKAEECYRQVIKSSPLRVAAHEGLAEVLLEKGASDEAITVLRDATRLLPDDAVLLNNLGHLLRVRGQVTDAIGVFQQATRVDPAYALPRLNLGIALSELGRLAEAISSFDEAARIDPSVAKSVDELVVNALCKGGRLNEAIDRLAQATQRKPGDAFYHRVHGVTLRDAGRPLQALPHLREACRLGPRDSENHYQLGATLHVTGALDDAVESLREAVRLRPAHAPNHSYIGAVLCERGTLEAGVDHLRQAIALNPRYAQDHRNLGFALERLGLHDEACARLKEALRLEPQNGELHYHLGTSLFARLGKVAEAEQHLRESVRLRPEHPESRCNLGLVLSRQGRFREALEHLRSGHELGSRSLAWRYPSQAWVDECERDLETEAFIALLPSPDSRPTEPTRLLEMARHWGICSRVHLAATLYEEGFLAAPGIADGPQNHRYRAACCAAMAGTARGVDVNELGPDQRERWRQQSLKWLRQELAGRTTRLRSGEVQDRLQALRDLAAWQQEPNFEGVRGEAALAKLPEDERQGWQALWREVADLLARAEPARAPPPSPAGRQDAPPRLPSSP